MKKLIASILFLASTAMAEQVNWRNLYQAIAFHETSSGKNIPNRTHKDVGIIQINKGVISDLNNIILKGKLKRPLTLRDALNKENSYRMMYWYTSYWAEKYQKRTGKKPSYLIYASIWRHGYVGLRRKGRFNKYAISVRNYANDLDWSDSQDAMYREFKKQRGEK